MILNTCCLQQLQCCLVLMRDKIQKCTPVVSVHIVFWVLLASMHTMNNVRVVCRHATTLWCSYHSSIGLHRCYNCPRIGTIMNNAVWGLNMLRFYLYYSFEEYIANFKGPLFGHSLVTYMESKGEWCANKAFRLCDMDLCCLHMT